MSSSPGTPWVHDDEPAQPQPMDRDDGDAASVRGDPAAPTSHPLETPTHSVVVGHAGGDNGPTNDAAPPRAEL